MHGSHPKRPVKGSDRRAYIQHSRERATRHKRDEETAGIAVQDALRKPKLPPTDAKGIAKRDDQMRGSQYPEAESVKRNPSSLMSKRERKKVCYPDPHPPSASPNLSQKTSQPKKKKKRNEAKKKQKTSKSALDFPSPKDGMQEWSIRSLARASRPAMRPSERSDGGGVVVKTT